MTDIKIRQGETLELDITADDSTADTVQLLVADEDGAVIINETESFSTVDGKRVAALRTDDTDHPVGEYEYQLVVEYEDGFIEKLPDAEDCDDEDTDCDLPTFTICKSIEAGVS